MRVLVTRPQPQAAQWAERLRGQGIDAHALPLLATAASPDRTAVQAAWQSLGRQALVVFVSPAAVSHFFAARPAQGAEAWPAAVLAATPGPGTGAALREAGVPPSCVLQPAADAEQFDSESLWEVLRERAWAGRRVLVVRGDGGRDWLAERLAEAGAVPSFVAAYRRAAPLHDAAEQRLLARALASPGEHLWLFSSSQAVDQLDALAPGADWRPARALASHPRIAQRARQLGCGEVREVAPRFEAVLEALRSQR